MEQGIFDYLEEINVDDVQWEKGPLLEIAKNNQLAAFKHFGFWKPMDALRDKIELDEYWNKGDAPWKIW
jgi:glucose-1-phosphate cytidylyltransferase